MKKIFFSIIFIVTTCALFAQHYSKHELLNVVNILQLDDYVFLTGVSYEQDTVSIIITKKQMGNKIQAIWLNKCYDFELQKHSIFTGDVIFRIKDSIIWKPGDDLKNMPYFCINFKTTDCLEIIQTIDTLQFSIDKN